VGDWRSALRSDPLPWLLEQDTPAVRHLALRLLLDEPEDAPAVRRARSRAMKVDPIGTILDAQEPEGYWDRPGGGYGPKYTGTVWSVMFLDQMGADPRDRRVRRAVEYVLDHSIARRTSAVRRRAGIRARPRSALFAPHAQGNVALMPHENSGPLVPQRW
jgi:hypothetical protein